MLVDDVGDVPVVRPAIPLARERAREWPAVALVPEDDRGGRLGEDGVTYGAVELVVARGLVGGLRVDSGVAQAVGVGDLVACGLHGVEAGLAGGEVEAEVALNSGGGGGAVGAAVRDGAVGGDAEPRGRAGLRHIDEASGLTVADR